MSHQQASASTGPWRYTRRCSGATVEDSHEGPLNNQGKPAWNPQKMLNTNELTHKPKTHARRNHDLGGPRGPPGVARRMPDAVGVHGDRASPRPPLCRVRTPRWRHPRTGPRAAARQPTTTPPPSKLLLYEHRMRHDASTGAGFGKTAVSSVALLATPSHVGK
jgi:hypothetical protein